MPISDVLLEQPEETSPELWQRFISAESEEEYFRHWLALQCHMIPMGIQAVLVTHQGDGPFTPIATWPGRGAEPARLAEVLKRVIEERCGLLLELENADHRFGIAYPLILDEQVPAIVAMEISATDEETLRQSMERLQWGVAWLEVLYRRQRAQAESATLSRLQAAVDLLAVTLGEEHFHAAAMSFVTELAAAADCDRVSLGFLQGSRIHIEAVSNSTEVGTKMNLTRAIASAMDEAILQRKELLYPPPPDTDVLIVHNHEKLSRQQNQAHIVSFPLFEEERYYGALTCERPADHPFSPRDVEFFRALLVLVTPALRAKELNDRPLPVKIKDSAATQFHRLFGPRYLGRKLIGTLLLGLVFFFSFAKGDYRLAAETSLEGAERRAVVAPFNSYIDLAPARAGDLVEQGALLCTLDDRDLRLERRSRISQRSQLQRQHQNAVAKYDRAQANIIEAQLDQAKAELELIEAQLQRTRLAAPFSGLLVSGDLSQRLGGAVEKGEVLFEITPLNAYRVILEVDERRICDVRTGQHGNLVLSAQPGTTYDFTISKVTPITTAANGRNFFRVEAQLAEVHAGLRPGMEGIGKILVDRRHLIAIWSRELIEYLRLWTWRWLP